LGTEWIKTVPSIEEEEEEEERESVVNRNNLLCGII
jgi:hypothetical protein